MATATQDLTVVRSHGCELWGDVAEETFSGDQPLSCPRVYPKPWAFFPFLLQLSGLLGQMVLPLSWLYRKMFPGDYISHSLRQFPVVLLFHPSLQSTQSQCPLQPGVVSRLSMGAQWMPHILACVLCPLSPHSLLPVEERENSYSLEWLRLTGGVAYQLNMPHQI